MDTKIVHISRQREWSSTKWFEKNDLNHLIIIIKRRASIEIIYKIITDFIDKKEHNSTRKTTEILCDFTKHPKGNIKTCKIMDNILDDDDFLQMIKYFINQQRISIYKILNLKLRIKKYHENDVLKGFMKITFLDERNQTLYISEIQTSAILEYWRV